MSRPTVTKEMKRAAAIEVAKSTDVDVHDIAQAYSYPMDGYQLARELDDHYHCDISASDVEELDAMDSLVRQELERAERQWVEREGIIPKLGIGTAIKKGVIAGVSEHAPATYKVKQHGCEQDGRFLLIKFEVAEAENLDAAIAA